MHYALIISVIINFLLVGISFYSNKTISRALDELHEKIKEQDKLNDNIMENVKDILLLLPKQFNSKNDKNSKYIVDPGRH